MFSLAGISTDARKLTSFNTSAWDNNDQYQCNNPIIFIVKHGKIPQTDIVVRRPLTNDLLKSFYSFGKAFMGVIQSGLGMVKVHHIAFKILFGTTAETEDKNRPVKSNNM